MGEVGWLVGRQRYHPPHPACSMVAERSAMPRTRLLQRCALVQALAMVTTAVVLAVRSGSKPAARNMRAMI